MNKNSSNYYNPLNWLQRTQDWFVRAEISSGFRPLLILIIICFVIGLALRFFLPERLIYISLLIIVAPIVVFLVIFCIKSFTQPDFCRSEKHVQTMRRIEMEKLGSELDQYVDKEIIDSEIDTDITEDDKALENRYDKEFK